MGRQKKKGQRRNTSKSVVEVLNTGNAKSDEQDDAEFSAKMEEQTRQVLLQRQMLEVKKKAEDAAQKIVDQERQRFEEERQKMQETLLQKQNVMERHMRISRKDRNHSAKGKKKK